MTQRDFISHCTSQVNAAREFAEWIKTMPSSTLTENQTGGWSALQCLEHLSLYADHYIPEIERRLLQAGKGDSAIRRGALGKFAARAMAPMINKRIGFKMKTFRDKEPPATLDASQCITRFLRAQWAYEQLILQAATLDLNRPAVRLSVPSLIRLRLCDAFLFVLNHQDRHLLQARRALPSHFD